MRNWLRKAGFTAFFLVWEGYKRIRGAWRRREWRNLGRYALHLGAVAVLLAWTGFALVGCAVIPASTFHSACDVIDIASREADLAPAWYLRAGEVLEVCGEPDAKAQAAVAACAAQRRSGYGCSEN